MKGRAKPFPLKGHSGGHERSVMFVRLRVNKENTQDSQEGNVGWSAHKLPCHFRGRTDDPKAQCVERGPYVNVEFAFTLG